jgi:hypothetical protein
MEVAVVLKPFDFDDFLAVVRNLLLASDAA